MGISQSRLEQLRGMIADGNPDPFYDWPEWNFIRHLVLTLDSFECQECKKKRRFRAAKVVHHVKHLRDRPDLALSVCDYETSERQLVSLCRACHEEQHPERGLTRYPKRNSVLTAERWD